MFRFLAVCLLIGGAACAGDLVVVNEVAALVNARIVDVRAAAALLDAGSADRDAPEVRRRLDGVRLRHALGGEGAAAPRAFMVGVRTLDQRLVLFRFEGQTLVWSSTTLASELRLLPGFRNGETDFPPDFDYTGSDFNRRRYGGVNVVDELDYMIRCTSSPDSNGSTLSCANGYGLEVFYSRCYLTLDDAVACESRPE